MTFKCRLQRIHPTKGVSITGTARREPTLGESFFVTTGETFRVTTPVVDILGDRFTTESGSIYEVQKL